MKQALWSEPSAEQLAEWSRWVESRPPIVRNVARKVNPFGVYVIQSTGTRCAIESIEEPESGRPEDVTVKVLVPEEGNPGNLQSQLWGDYHVFGLKLEDLSLEMVP